MNRAAREGRYTGGIVPLGYRVEGRKQTARLIPSDKILWGDWTEADLVRKLYHWMAIEGWTCPRISRHLNALGVPTAYTKDERWVRRGQRKERTQGFWWPGRVRSIVTNPVYRGELQYGRRSTKPGGREVISAFIPALVTPEVWAAAQATLAKNQIMSRNTDRVYLLKSVIRCGCCGRYYVGCWSRKYPRYRCNGQLTDRRPIQERCPSKTVKDPDLEPVVWDDIQRFLRDPGDILEELERERNMDQGVIVAEAEIVTLETALAGLAQRKKKAIDLNLRNRISDEELDELLLEIYREQEGVEQRLRELQESLSESPEPLNVDLLSELRRRLDEGLNERERQEIVQLLVKRITVYTEISPEGKKAKVLIQYRFPGVVNVSTGTPALPFCHSTLTASRAASLAYPKELMTLGDHLRKERLDRGLPQREVAQQLEVDPMSISYWETNKYAPSLREIPKIIGFLGYVPYDTASMTIGERILTMRRCLGLSREELAKQLGVDESTLRDWEHGRRKPLKSNLAKLDEVLGSLAGHISLQKP
jgi:transcriptional regulator with XRE-family HTH domain